MNRFLKGGVALLIMSMLVAIAYASNAGVAPTTESQEITENNISFEILDTDLVNTTEEEVVTDDEKKKLVEKTGSVRAAGAGRGSFTATAYCLRGKTAMGHGVRRGLIAADPRVLRLGSRVTLNGGGYNGSYLVSDTGGKIKGKKIDIWVPSCSEARRFGRRTVQVFSN